MKRAVWSATVCSVMTDCTEESAEGGTEKLTVVGEIRMSIVETKKQLGCYRWFRVTGLEVWT